ncbi:MAG: rhodanese-like domain-containing protein [Gammaproteobacteria bacterium]|nr:MAG: rhodanese-like domain-containing protein [Gammaproteobacteria bacterium]
MKNILKVVTVLICCQWFSLAVSASEGLWIDVRSAAEYEQGHLPGAINVTHTEIGYAITSLAPDKNKPIRLYCGSGRRAGMALQTLESMGYTKASNEGGYSELINNQK